LNLVTPASPANPGNPGNLHDGTEQRLTRLGGWLFAHRTRVPLPIALVLLLTPSATSHPAARWAGVVAVAAGELLRLWAVRQIGVISRTRSDRLGPLIDSGPFAYVRNPLYLGNIALWVGFTLSAGLLWLVPAVVLLLAVQYHAIVRWEEALLTARRGAAYMDYMRRVPRWLPRYGGPPPIAGQSTASRPAFSWRETLFSERGTLAAILAGYVLLWLKQTAGR
jgi:protein-S-isoprenylcysteine O-methyltransferase Ste14